MKDIGVQYTIVRGKLDSQPPSSVNTGDGKRKQARSKYGQKVEGK